MNSREGKRRLPRATIVAEYRAGKSCIEIAAALGCSHGGVIKVLKQAGEPRRTRAAALRRHGQSGTPVYHVWNAMIQRCTNPKNPKYADYGGRGIRVCDEWRNSFEAFARYVGERPEGLTLDRWPNNDGNYEPGNVRWATYAQQSANSRPRERGYKSKQPMRVFLTRNGETKSLQAWARELSINRQTMNSRIRRGHDPFTSRRAPK